MNQEDIERAIKYGTEWLKDEYLDARDGVFIEIALKALKQMPVTTTAGEGGAIYYPQVEGVTPTVVDVGKQEPCEDAISREDALMCLTGEIKDTDTIETIIARSARRIRKLPSVNPRPCEDAISRQAVIDSLHSKFADGFDSDRWWNSMSVLYAINKVPPVNPTKTGHCKDCKWWKDSDGTYCRGIHAESKCPINRKEVLEGNGYCYMFEPLESEEKE